MHWCTVTGCANPDIPAHAWFRRTADGHAVMGCQHSTDTSSFRCVDNVWRGSFINCSECEHFDLSAERTLYVIQNYRVAQIKRRHFTFLLVTDECMYKISMIFWDI